MPWVKLFIAVPDVWTEPESMTRWAWMQLQGAPTVAQEQTVYGRSQVQTPLEQLRQSAVEMRCVRIACAVLFVRS